MNNKLAKLVPCEDGSMADPAIGCVNVPDAILGSQSSLLNIILKIADGLVTLAVVIAAAVLIYGGIRYSISMGNEEGVKNAKSILFWSVFGLVVALLAKYIVITILSIIT